MICCRYTRTDRPQGIDPAENSTVQKVVVDRRSRVDGHESNQSPKSVTSELLELAKTGKPDRVLTQYVWGARPGHRDELVLRDRATVSSEELDERLYCLMDYFDPTSAVDTEGEVVERYGFSAFGVREVMAADWSSRAQSWFAWEFGFHGQFLDTETGYYNYGYRYYVPELGRWPNRDPIGEEGFFTSYTKNRSPEERAELHNQSNGNLYSAMMNNSIQRIDSDGAAIVAISVSTFFLGSAVINGALACVACYQLTKCIQRGKQTAERAVSILTEEDAIEFIRIAKPISECIPLLSDCGKHGIKAAFWVGSKFLVFRYTTLGA